MFGLFDPEYKIGHVYKNKFWEIAERVGANMSKHEIDSCFKIFDGNGKGYFTFQDFTKVSKLVQGFEIDQVFNFGEKYPYKARGKRCKGYNESYLAEYDAQKNFKQQHADLL